MALSKLHARLPPAPDVFNTSCHSRSSAQPQLLRGDPVVAHGDARGHRALQELTRACSRAMAAHGGSTATSSRNRSRPTSPLQGQLLPCRPAPLLQRRHPVWDDTRMVPWCASNFKHGRLRTCYLSNNCALRSSVMPQSSRTHHAGNFGSAHVLLHLAAIFLFCCSRVGSSLRYERRTAAVTAAAIALKGSMQTRTAHI